MKPEELEALYFTPEEAAAYLNVSKNRIRRLALDGMILKLKGSIYYRPSVEEYKLKRGDKKAGRYPKQ